jgi:hypothetical protein
MNCWNCNSQITNRPWNHLANIQEIDENDKDIYVDKYICGYSCYCRLSEKNILPRKMWPHIVNKEDYRGLIRPVVSNKVDFQYLTHGEISEMNDIEKEIYYKEKDKQIEFDAEISEIREELEREDIRTSQIENVSDSEDIIDDY